MKVAPFRGGALERWRSRLETWPTRGSMRESNFLSVNSPDWGFRAVSVWIEWRVLRSLWVVSPGCTESGPEKSEHLPSKLESSAVWVGIANRCEKGNMWELPVSLTIITTCSLIPPGKSVQHLYSAWPPDVTLSSQGEAFLQR